MEQFEKMCSDIIEWIEKQPKIISSFIALILLLLVIFGIITIAGFTINILLDTIGGFGIFLLILFAIMWTIIYKNMDDTDK